MSRLCMKTGHFIYIWLDIINNQIEKTVAKVVIYRMICLYLP